MRSPQDDIEALKRTERLEHEAVNLSDVQAELMGVNVKANRFVPEHVSDRHEIQKKRADSRTRLLTHLIITGSLEWQKIYDKTVQMVQHIDHVVMHAMDEARARLQQHQDKLDALEARANRMHDHTMVFRDQDDRIVNQHGVAVDSVDAASVVWREDAPTYEEYITQKERLTQTQERIEQLERYQVEVIGTARERLSDEDTPPSVEELEQLQRDMLDKAPAFIRHRLDAQPEEQDYSNVSSQAIMVPKL